MRLTSSGAGRLQWVGGAFFSNLHSLYKTINQSTAYAPFSFGGTSANPDGIIYNANNPYVLKQYALFGDASYRFNDEFKLTTGLRWYKYDTNESYSQAGLDAQSGNAQAITGSVVQSAHGYNPKITLSYTPNPDLTLYSTISRGFRPGGVSLPVPTTGAVICPAEPLTYRPDSVWNYEVGEKAKLIGDRLVINNGCGCGHPDHPRSSWSRRRKSACSSPWRSFERAGAWCRHKSHLDALKDILGALPISVADEIQGPSYAAYCINMRDMA